MGAVCVVNMESFLNIFELKVLECLYGTCGQKRLSQLYMKYKTVNIIYHAESVNLKLVKQTTVLEFWEWSSEDDGKM
jgi:hypothetical protein